MAIATGRLAELHPRLYHMAAAESWPSIRRHGLLCASALLDLFGVRGCERERLERRHRTESVPIRHPEHGRAIIRDQKPMPPQRLEMIQCDGVPVLRDGLTSGKWYETLNSKVFLADRKTP